MPLPIINHFINSSYRVIRKIGFRVVPVGTRYEEYSLYYTMNNNDKIADIILQALHHIPDYLSIRDNILTPLKIDVSDKEVMLIRRRLAMLDLIEEQEPNSPVSLIKITPKGYQAIEYFGTYEAYCKEQKKLATSEREILYLKEKNIRLKNLNIIIGIISFIAGLLLSTPARNILRQWLVSDQ